MAVGLSGSKACLTSDSETFVNFFLSRKTSIVRFLWPRLGELTFDCPGGKFKCKYTPHLGPTSERIRVMVSEAGILSSTFMQLAYSDWRNSTSFHRAFLVPVTPPPLFAI